MKTMSILDDSSKIKIQLDWLNSLKFGGYYSGPDFAVLERAASEGEPINIAFDTIGIKEVIIVSTERRHIIKSINGNVLDAVLYVEGVIVGDDGD